MKKLLIAFAILLPVLAAAGASAELRSDVLLKQYKEKIKNTPKDQYEQAMSEASPPVHIIGGIYYVGSTAVSSFVISTDAGLILVDAGTPMMFDVIKRNVEALGFSLTDIKYIVSSHAHWDHVGGIAEMKKRTGAKVVALGLDAESIATGKDISAVSFLGLHWKGTPVDYLIKDQESFSLGGVTLQAHETPGHTKGCTTWTTTINHKGKPHKVLFLGGTSVNAGVKLLNNPLYPGIVEDYKKTFSVLRQMSPDVFLAQHPFFFDLPGKVEALMKNPATNPFINPSEWVMFIQNDELKFLRQLEDEQRRALSATPN